MQVQKLQDQIKTKLFDTKSAKTEAPKGKENAKPDSVNMPQMTAHSKITPSNEVKFSKMSADSDMSLMISKSMEEMNKKLTAENHDLKDCLKLLQREMFDIVKLKSDVYMKRFKAENYNPNDQQAFTSEEIIKSELTKIKENLFNMNFEENGKEIIHKFKLNF